MSRLVVPCLFASLLAWGVVPATPGQAEWKLDVIHRKKGEPLRGLVIEQGARSVTIRCVSQRRGSPRVVITEVVPRSEIARLELLGKEDREQLRKRLEMLKREREVLAEHLRALDASTRPGEYSGDAFDLESVAWPGDAKVRALGYESTHFRLVARTRPELARLAAIHLEQIYAAYARALPPRIRGARATTVLLTGSRAEYQKLARARGLNLFNPAFYDPARNQVVCGSDLERMGDELQKVRAHHEKLLAAIEERRGELMKVYRGKVPVELLAPLNDGKSRIAQSDRRNTAEFAAVGARLFRRLYHEAFHAYVGTFVYPAAGGGSESRESDSPSTTQVGAMPVWLNEGLAQIFESAILEVGELRIGHADPGRYVAVRQAVARGKLLPLTDLLRAEPRQFQVVHAGEKQASDRHYLAAWALAFYLTFEVRVLGTETLDSYVHALHRGTDPVTAFRDLVGKPLAEFEKEFHLYLRRLRQDGTTG